MLYENPQYQTKVLAASGLVKTGSGQLGGFIANASSTLVIAIYDNTSAAGTKLLDNMTLTAGTYVPFPAGFVTGCYIQFVSGTGSLTALYN